MQTKHLAIETAIRDMIAARSTLLPEVNLAWPRSCDENGLLFLGFEAPVEEDQRLGTGDKDWIRPATITLVVQGVEPVKLRDLLDLRIVEIGRILPQLRTLKGVDHVEWEAPDYQDEVDLESDAPLLGAEIEMTIHYTTGENALEAMR